MANGNISIDRIISKLDDYLHKNDYTGAERHLTYWLAEADALLDAKTALTLLNELMGLYRKISQKEKALSCVERALETVEKLKISHQVGAATTYLNSATVYKAFKMAEDAIPLFEKAKDIYEKELESSDARLGGLYNNMALALVDLGKYNDAHTLYSKAIEIMKNTENGALEVAITYLNMASALECEHGTVDADEMIQPLLDKAEALLEEHPRKDGYYAFVCEKCASVFDYYGRFVFANELKERSRRIYNR